MLHVLPSDTQAGEGGRLSFGAKMLSLLFLLLVLYIFTRARP
jgi:hypothetical protein